MLRVAALAAGPVLSKRRRSKAAVPMRNEAMMRMPTVIHRLMRMRKSLQSVREGDGVAAYMGSVVDGVRGRLGCVVGVAYYNHAGTMSERAQRGKPRYCKENKTFCSVVQPLV